MVGKEGGLLLLHPQKRVQGVAPPGFTFARTGTPFVRPTVARRCGCYLRLLPPRSPRQQVNGEIAARAAAKTLPRTDGRRFYAKARTVGNGERETALLMKGCKRESSFCAASAYALLITRPPEGLGSKYANPIHRFPCLP